DSSAFLEEEEEEEEEEGLLGNPRILSSSRDCSNSRPIRCSSPTQTTNQVPALNTGGGGGRQGGPHHGYSQNRRWHQHPKHQTNSFNQGPSGADRGLTRNTKETENVKHEEPEPHVEKGAKDEPAKEERKKEEKEEKTESGKICLL
ncbi:hypothetical protein M9458_042777, partial [Cirrhinus mrigala]